MDTDADTIYMRLAIEQAQLAQSSGEVPIGAVVVLHDQVVATGYNRTITDNDASGHAEIVAIRKAGSRLGNARLIETRLYVTVEPCVMCVGAIVQARIKALVFGAREPRTGAVVSAFEVLNSEQHNHRVLVTEGILADECALIMKEFFRARRG